MQKTRLPDSFKAKEKIMKRSIVLLLVLVIGITLLAGCGGGKKDSSGSGASGNDNSGSEALGIEFSVGDGTLTLGDSGETERSGNFPVGGNGMLSYDYTGLVAKIKELGDYWGRNEGDKLTYDLVIKTLGGVEGEFDEEWEDGVRYYWYAAGNTGGANLTFVMDNAKLMYKSASYSENMTKD